MKRVLSKVCYLLFGLAIKLRLYYLIVWFYSNIIKERMADGRMVCPSNTSKNGDIIILALTSDHFRTDLDVLGETGKFRILQIMFPWQNRLVNYFLRCRMERNIYVKYPSSHPVFKRREKLLRFLRKFLPLLYKRIGINCVIGSSVELTVDLDWGEVSREIGVPYIVIHRECLLSRELMKTKLKERWKNISFNSSHIIVHNEHFRQFVIEMGCVKPELISSLGCIRMDKFLNQIRKFRKDTNKKKKILLIPFYSKEGRYYKELYLLSCNVILAFVQFALDNHSIEVIIKPKINEHSLVIKIMNGIQETIGKTINEIHNLHIISDINIQELLLDVNIVCGLRSTVLLEAAIAGKPVIIPYFKEIQHPKYVEYLSFIEAFALFDIAENANELKSIILKRLDDNIISKEIMAKRKMLFEKYVSSTEGDATEKYVTLIKEIVNKQNRNDLVNR